MDHNVIIEAGQIPPTMEGRRHVYRMRCTPCSRNGDWLHHLDQARAEAARHHGELTAHTAYAFHPRQGDLSRGGYHAVLDQPLNLGRLRRSTGDALCRPRTKFWGLERGGPDARVTCPACREKAARYRVTLTTP